MKDTETKSVIDTSKMNAEERAALEMTEKARDKGSKTLSLGGSFFMGSPDFAELAPFPAQPLEDEDQGDAFLRKLHELIEEEGIVDPDQIDEEGEIPDVVIKQLAALGAFGIKIPTEYGGLGLSQTNYCRAAMYLGGICGNLTALVSAHQSIGVPQPLLMFGTDEQKKKFLPRIAEGEITAFALTEPEVGSDPARMKTTATLSKDGDHYIINGEKLWCTNGLKADLLVVMARTSDSRITAFVVDVDSPGIEIVNRCRFMGLKALYNGVIHFENVKVPKENIILGEGRGLKVALSTLNIGRLTLPAACAGLSKRCLDICKDWASKRRQWGAEIGKHAAIADKVARMAADTFAMESMVHYISGRIDRDKKADIRIEAAMAKMWGTEKSWRIVDDTMQIRGGRGYETAQSLKARGEEPVPVERLFRDSRINTIFEGSSEIMRLFIAREALDPHLRVGAAVLNTTLSKEERMKAALNSAKFYGMWYPAKWLPLGSSIPNDMHSVLKKHLRAVARESRKLARRLFHAMAINGPKLEKEQVLLGRFVDIAAELFAMSVTCARADHLLKSKGDEETLHLADYFCERSLLEIAELHRGISSNVDKKGYKLARKVMFE